MNSSKADFLSDTDRAKRWNELSASTSFLEAVRSALLEMLERTRGTNAYEDQAALHRLQGAKQFAHLLCSLGIKEAPVQRKGFTALEQSESDVPAHLRPRRPETLEQP